MNVDVVSKSCPASVIPQETCFVSLVDGTLQMFGLEVEFPANIDIGSVGAHCESGNQTALNELVRIVAHDFSVFTSPRLSFICVDDEIVWAPI